MKRLAVKHAFQVLSIFYLVVTCLCSSLNIDAPVKGALPSEGEVNESLLAIPPPVDKAVPKDVKNSPQPVKLTSKDVPVELSERNSVPDLKNGASTPPGKAPGGETTQKTVPSPPNSNTSDQGSSASAASASPSSPASAQPEVHKASNDSAAVTDGAAAVPDSIAPAEAVGTEAKGQAVEGGEKPAPVDAQVDAKNATKERGTSGEQPPEDGSDVPTFDEYQRKFTSSGGATKDGAGSAGSPAGSGQPGGQVKAAKKEDPNGHGGQAAGGKIAGGAIRQQSFKNVGSTTCGAKVISHNGEASNPAYVLNENRDEYMNNPCAVKKWIVIEACEPVRLRKIEMASYELFSSMVQSFRVSSSERFPQKMWDVVGTFAAKNEKGVQTYLTEQDKYYKYFKFEFLDHYGNEHFCPVSLIRLFGVLVEDDDGEEDTSDTFGGLDNESGQTVGSEDDEAAAMVRLRKTKDTPSRSLLQSAKEAIVGIVQNTLRPTVSKLIDEFTDYDRCSGSRVPILKVWYFNFFQASSSKGVEGSPSSSNASSNVTAAGDNSTSGLPSGNRAPLDSARVMNLMRLLFSGDYSALLQRCLELLRRAPPVVHQNFVEHQVIPSPSVAYGACAKALVRSKISANELRWAYLAFNNDSYPWEGSGGAAAITSKLRGQVDSPGEQNGRTERQNHEEPPPAVPQPPPPPPPPVPVPQAATEDGEKTATKAGEPSEAAAEKTSSEKAAEAPQVVKKEEKEEKKANGAAKMPEPAKEPAAASEAVKEDKQTEQKAPQPPQQEEKPQQESGGEKPQAVDAKLPSERPTPPAEAAKEKQADPQKPQDTPQGEQQAAQPSEQHQQPPPSSPPQQEQQQGKQQPKQQADQQEHHQQAKQPHKPPQHKTGAEGGTGGNGRAVGIKENAYMRLSNKVKDMERNITISMGYLEELSRSYKKKTDKLSKQLEKALTMLEETRELTEKQASRIGELEARVKSLQEDYHGRGIAELTREHTRLRQELLLQGLAFYFILLVAHLMVFLLCRRRNRAPSLLTVNGNATATRAWHSAEHMSTAGPRSDRTTGLSHSNSDSNLCIVDPPFRFEDPFIKKFSSESSLRDSKKRRKKKRNSTAGQSVADRSSSASRIEQLVL